MSRREPGDHLVWPEILPSRKVNSLYFPSSDHLHSPQCTYLGIQMVHHHVGRFLQQDRIRLVAHILVEYDLIV